MMVTAAVENYIDFIKLSPVIKYFELISKSA